MQQQGRRPMRSAFSLGTSVGELCGSEPVFPAVRRTHQQARSMWLSEHVCPHVSREIGLSDFLHAGHICPVVVETARRRPPESNCVSVFRRLLALVQVLDRNLLLSSGKLLRCYVSGLVYNLRQLFHCRLLCGEDLVRGCLQED